MPTDDGSFGAGTETAAGLKALAGKALELVRTRASLIALEVEVEQARAVKALLYAAAGLMAAFMATTVLVVLAVASLWDSPYRVALMFALAIGLLLAGLALAGQARQSVLATPRPFQATLEALANDITVMK